MKKALDQRKSPQEDTFDIHYSEVSVFQVVDVSRNRLDKSGGLMKLLEDSHFFKTVVLFGVRFLSVGKGSLKFTAKEY